MGFVLIGGGDMGQLVRERDWSQTPLGNSATWPQSLRSSLSLVLNAKGIAALYWGPEQWLLYNDAYGQALGERHPQAFGRPMPEVLTDIAPVLGPQVAEVLRTGEGFAIENVPLVMRRHGRDEDTAWTYSFSPIQGEEGTFAGVLLLATELTQQKTAERAQAEAATALRELATRQVAALTIARLGTYQWVLASGAVELDQRSREIFGFAEGQGTTAQEVFDRIHPDDLPAVHAHAMEAASRLDRLEVSYRITLPSGELRYVSSQGAFVVGTDGAAERAIGVFADVTDQRNAQIQISEERALSANFIEHLPIGVCLVGQDGKVQLTNPAYNRLRKKVTCLLGS